MDTDLLQSVQARFSAFDRQSKDAGFDLDSVISRYSWVGVDHIRKDGQPQLRLARLNAVDPAQQQAAAGNKNAPIWFITTTFEEDRDGDVVVPRGVKTKNFQDNPLIFFGHQELVIPVAKGVQDGELLWRAEDHQCRGGALFNTKNPDAMFVRENVLDGYLNACSIAFVPEKAFKRGASERHKAEPRHEGDRPLGWVFEEVDLTEWSIVGIPANAGAIRDRLDQEKSFISPACQKVYSRYAAVAKTCFNGWCRPCETKVGKPTTLKEITATGDSGAVKKGIPPSLLRRGETFRVIGGSGAGQIGYVDRVEQGRVFGGLVDTAGRTSSGGVEVAYLEPMSRSDYEQELRVRQGKVLGTAAVNKDVRVIPYRGQYTLARPGETRPLYPDALFDSEAEAFEWARQQRINPVKGMQKGVNQQFVSAYQVSGSADTVTEGNKLKPKIDAAVNSLNGMSKQDLADTWEAIGGRLHSGINSADKLRRELRLRIEGRFGASMRVHASYSGAKTKSQLHDWPDFSSDPAERRLLADHAPTELEAWRTVQHQHYQPLSQDWDTADRLRHRGKLEAAYTALKRAWQRIQQGQKSHKQACNCQGKCLKCKGLVKKSSGVEEEDGQWWVVDYSGLQDPVGPYKDKATAELKLRHLRLTKPAWKSGRAANRKQGLRKGLVMTVTGPNGTYRIEEKNGDYLIYKGQSLVSLVESLDAAEKEVRRLAGKKSLATAKRKGHLGEYKSVRGTQHKDSAAYLNGLRNMKPNSPMVVNGHKIERTSTGYTATDGYSCRTAEDMLRHVGVKSLATTSGATGGYTVPPTKQEVAACYTRALAAGDNPATACGTVERQLGVRLDVRKDGTLRGFRVKAMRALRKGAGKRGKAFGDAPQGYFKAGDKVVVTQGPAADMEGVVIRMTAGGQVLIRDENGDEETFKQNELRKKSARATIRKSDEDDQGLEHATDAADVGVAKDGGEEDAPTSAPPLAMALAATHQHHLALKDYLDEQKSMLEESKAGMEPEHHAVVDQHVATLDDMASKAEESANDVGELFAKRYPEHDIEAVKDMAAPPPNEGNDEGLEGEDGYTAMAEDEDQEVEMEEGDSDAGLHGEQTAAEDGEEYVSMAEEGEEEEKGDEDAEEILDRYRNPAKGGKRGALKRAVKSSLAGAQITASGRVKIQGLSQSMGITYAQAEAKVKAAFNLGAENVEEAILWVKTGEVKSTHRSIAKNATCMAEAGEFLASLADGEDDPIRRAAISHHAQKLKDEGMGVPGVTMDLGNPSGGPPEEGDERYPAKAADDEEEEVEEKAVEGSGEEELEEDEESPAKANGTHKALANGIGEVTKGTAVLTDGLLAMKKRLGL